MLPAGEGVSFINAIRTPVPTGESTAFTLRPMTGMSFTASTLTFESAGGTVSKSIEYCVRIN